MRLAEHQYQTVKSVRGPLVFLERVFQARLGELVRIITPEGGQLNGEVLKISEDQVLIQVFGDTHGLDTRCTTVIFSDAVMRAPLGEACLGRLFDGSFRPRDGLPMFLPESWQPVIGAPINPVARANPEEFIETGFSTIDGLNTLVKGQKLPIFSCAGLPARELTDQLLRQARLPDGGPFVLVFVALGLTHFEFQLYQRTLETMPSRFVAFINLADDPAVERLLAPRVGLTVAEDLAFSRGMDVLVIITDMTNYCDALREIATAREELPGRRGYPGHMYSDLASLYERAGRLHNRPGSITMLPIVTMPEDDITHPIPDLTGYITEGQIVLARELNQKGIYPPIDVLPSLSRLMQQGIGKGYTRADHRVVANRLYRAYAKGRDLRRLEAVVGREGMLADDQLYLDFADQFEQEFVHQGNARRTIGDTLDLATRLLECLAEEEA
ncbi:MAG: V-type ATP synthase subunit B [Deltaproteobacteria bacterium]|jgi:V/A-type H+-transporting ATPase subunit B|nr:V-type ATP synthase subunit B [Deltaproteobacteria bacterium]